MFITDILFDESMTISFTKVSFIEKDNLSTAFNFIREKVESGGQTIIVYPLINESEKQDLSAAVESYEYLRDNKFWPPVGRVDNVFGDRNLVCSCPSLQEYKEEAA